MNDTPKVVTVHCEVQFTLRADGDLAPVLPGRQALSDAIGQLLLPNGQEYVHMQVQDHMYVITACHRLHGVEIECDT